MDMSDTHTPGTTLVTGASGGIGAIYAERLAHRTAGETGRRVEVLAADLGEPDGLAVTGLGAVFRPGQGAPSGRHQ